ncbi:hypothetical protein BpHYR1_015643 [Brachionus plicatilis]|uniref:DUF4139 domain-containing protein n=1 Tax=Brachionus plicatilis TaxID=10195 RepID=A0A3M7QBN5_BRAPC|nr:hypothetical protein BpHYR1_015643 [Brachionus plicatilis]
MHILCILGYMPKMREQTRRESYMSSSSQLSMPSLAIRRASEIFTTERPQIKEPIFESFVDQTINLVACYDIKEQTSVAKDGQPVQVLIAKFDLNAEFLHEACPSRDRSVYIMARAKNTSDFLLLPGTASIYLNKNFWSKTNFKSQFPGEEFICPLGVDRSILLGIRSEKILSNQTGVVNKNKSNIYSKIIEIKNNSFKQAKILLKENLPLSIDEKVQNLTLVLVHTILKDKSFLYFFLNFVEHKTINFNFHSVAIASLHLLLVALVVSVEELNPTTPKWVKKNLTGSFGPADLVGQDFPNPNPYPVEFLIKTKYFIIIYFLDRVRFETGLCVSFFQQIIFSHSEKKIRYLKLYIPVPPIY